MCSTSTNRTLTGTAGWTLNASQPFNQLLRVTGAKVVVSSAWRYFVLRGEMTVQGLGGLLCTHGLLHGCVVDVLGPDQAHYNADRSALVKEWFAARYGVSHRPKYLCIDDMDLGYTEHKHPFLKTDGFCGIAPVDLDWVLEAYFQ